MKTDLALKTLTSLPLTVALTGVFALGSGCGAEQFAPPASRDAGIDSRRDALGAGGSGGTFGSGGSGGTFGSGGSGGIGGSGGYDAGAGQGGTGGTGGVGGNGGVSSGTDRTEPNNTEGMATELGTIDECDEDPATGLLRSVSGISAGMDDADYYHYVATHDAYWCIIDAEAATDSSDVELCLFWHCRDAATLQDCNDGNGQSTGATPQTSPDNRVGCCRTTPGSIYPSHGPCDTSNGGTADMFLRVRATRNMCTPYTVTYHY